MAQPVLKKEEMVAIADAQSSSKAKGNDTNLEVSFLRPDDKIFFEDTKMQDSDWKQTENVRLPYYKGSFIELKKDNINVKLIKVTVKCEDEKCPFIKKGDRFTFEAKAIHLYSDEAEKGIEDMVDLDKLNNATLLFNLKQRYCRPGHKDMYTYVTPTLLSINPYERLIFLESPDIIKKCHKFIDDPKMNVKELTPHVFSLAAKACRSMFRNKIRQAIVISGESGSGKKKQPKLL